MEFELEIEILKQNIVRDLLEHSNSGEKFRFDSILAIESIFFDSIRQFDKFAACRPTLVFK